MKIVAWKSCVHDAMFINATWCLEAKAINHTITNRMKNKKKQHQAQMFNAEAKTNKKRWTEEKKIKWLYSSRLFVSVSIIGGNNVFSGRAKIHDRSVDAAMA